MSFDIDDLIIIDCPECEYAHQFHCDGIDEDDIIRCDMCGNCFRYEV